MSPEPNVRPELIDFILVGAGNMGGAMLRGWVDAGLVGPQSAVVDPSPSPEMRALCDRYGIKVFNSPDEEQFSSITAPIIVLAIKPQFAAVILPQFSAIASGRTFVSVMAGQSLANITHHLGDGHLALIRAMPNIGASRGAGATGLFANAHVDPHTKQSVDTLMEATGAVVWVDEEAHIDVVTALSGSGPAYYFLLTQALEEAGRDLGLAPEAASTLARATAYGAGQLLRFDPRSAAELRQSVTSPGGTTHAAISVFEKDNSLRALTRDAMAAAVKRAGELKS